MAAAKLISEQRSCARGSVWGEAAFHPRLPCPPPDSVSFSLIPVSSLRSPGVPQHRSNSTVILLTLPLRGGFCPLLFDACITLLPRRCPPSNTKLRTVFQRNPTSICRLISAGTTATITFLAVVDGLTTLPCPLIRPHTFPAASWSRPHR